MSYRNERDPLRGRTVEQFHQEMDFRMAVRAERAGGRLPGFRNDAVTVFGQSGRENAPFGRAPEMASRSE